MSAKPSKSKLKNAESSGPWQAQTPYLTAGFQAARREVLNQRRSFYPGPLVAPFTPEEDRAFAATAARAAAGSPLLRQAQDYTAASLRGDHLQAGNPHLRAVIDQAAQPLVDHYRNAVQGIGSSFARAGRYGSASQALAEAEAQKTLGRSLAEQSASLAYGDHAAERARQERAAALAPQLAAGDYDDAAELARIGALKRSHAQGQIDGARARHDFDQGEAFERLQAYMRLISGNFGGSSSSAQQSFAPSQLDNGLKYAAAAAQLAALFL